METISRRQLLGTATAGLAWAAAACSKEDRRAAEVSAAAPATPPLRTPSGDVDWRAVRALFPLATDWTHLASFLLVSHPRPVAEAIERFRSKIDADPVWIEEAAFSDSG